MSTEVTANELGKYLGITGRRVGQLVKDGLPYKEIGKRKRYDLEAAIPWYISFIRTSKADQGYDKERTRLVKAQADKTELETQIRRGEVLELELVEQGMMGVAAEYSAQMDAIPGRIANDVAALSDVAKIQTLIHDQIRGVTDVVTDRLAAIAEYREDGGDTEAPTKKVSGGVG
jgi:phage terminase Nu1 subunit (DNA packaging protein)